MCFFICFNSVIIPTVSSDFVIFIKLVSFIIVFKLDSYIFNIQKIPNLPGEYYLSGDAKQPIDKVEKAFQALIKHRECYQKIPKKTRLSKLNLHEELAKLVTNQEISADDMAVILAVEKARWDAILVDEFTFDSMHKKQFTSVTDRLYP